MTNDYRSRKIIEAIAECDRFIAKEEPRNPSLRPAEVQKHLDFCKTHRERLIAMLSEEAARAA